LLDLENVVRELVIATMLSAYGADWWNMAGIDPGLQRKAEAIRKNEQDNPLHAFPEFHPTFCLDLTDLRKIIETENDKHAQKSGPASSPFAEAFAHYDEVHIPDKIGEIRALRNQVMHGKYLTKENIKLVEVICGQFHRFLVDRGHVGKFEERQLQRY
jgi:hypothetical protein